MPRVKSERDGSSILCAEAAMCTEDKELRVQEARRLPSHSGILGEAEEIAGRLGKQHLRRDRERALRPSSMGRCLFEKGGIAFQYGRDRYRVQVVRPAFWERARFWILDDGLGGIRRKSNAATNNATDMRRKPARESPVSACSRPTK